ncbi:MAG: hypothetical protein R2705_18395 [Ilumatobacteraceae bacterium]
MCSSWSPFNYVLAAIGAGAQVDYLQFLVPGVFVITALQGAQQTSMGFAADLAEGVTDRFRSLPMSQFAVIAGRTPRRRCPQRDRLDHGRIARSRHGLPVRLTVGSRRCNRGHHHDRVHLLLARRRHRGQGPTTPTWSACSPCSWLLP